MATVTGSTDGVPVPCATSSAADAGFAMAAFGFARLFRGLAVSAKALGVEDGTDAALVAFAVGRGPSHAAAERRLEMAPGTASKRQLG